MPSQAVAAYGTLLKMGDGGTPETFTTVAEVKDIRGPAMSRNTIDVTNHSSANGYEEFVLGVKRSGEITFTVNFVPTHTTHGATSGLWNKFDTGARANWQLVLPSSLGQLAFAAYVTGITPSAPVDGALEAEITLKVSGPVNLS